jgi:hypothetical protein
VDQIHPSIKEARTTLADDLEYRWMTNIEDEREKFYLICTLCDPRLKRLQFWGMTDDKRQLAARCLKAEYDVNWAPAAAPPQASVAPGLQLMQPIVLPRSALALVSCNTLSTYNPSQ